MTALQDILVVLDDTGRSDIRLAIAGRLAQKHNAHLTGISALDLVTPARATPRFHGYQAIDTWGPSHPMTGNDARVHEQFSLERGAGEITEEIQASFRMYLRTNGLRGDWRVTDGRSSEAFAYQARHADLVILGQVDPDHPPPPAGRQLAEDILMTAGRPVLVIPYAGQFETMGSRVLIGWNNSREAARAVNDALPLLTQAGSVTVLEVFSSGRMPATHEGTGADIIRHLAHHGIKAETARTVMGSISVSDALLGYAADISADLLVIGGYGHSRLRELILGGVTRELLHHMTLPVLMSH